MPECNINNWNTYCIFRNITTTLSIQLKEQNYTQLDIRWLLQNLKIKAAVSVMKRYKNTHLNGNCNKNHIIHINGKTSQFTTKCKGDRHVANWWTWDSKCSTAIAEMAVFPFYRNICIEIWFSTWLCWQGRLNILSGVLPKWYLPF